VEDRTYDGKGVFRGFELTQHSTSGRRAGGVMVFVRKKSWSLILGTVRNSGSGHFTIGAYESNGDKIIIGGIYGDCTSSDRPSADIFSEYEEWHRELRDRIGNVHTIIAGDFNLKMDVEPNYKPRAVRIVKSIMQEFGLDDAGGEMKRPTWRRPHLPKSRSRLDYILHSDGLKKESFTTTWGRGDHAELMGTFFLGNRKKTKVALKDWVFATEDFLSQASDIIRDVLLDHDKKYRCKSYVDREAFVNNRKPREYEMDMEIIEKGEGIFHSHILLVIINRLLTLQRRVQTEIIKKGRDKLRNLSKAIGDKYEEIDKLREGEGRLEDEISSLADLKGELKSYAENVEMARRTRISNFYLDNMGKSRAASYAVTKEPRASRRINKLTEDGREVSDKDEILNKLQDNFFGTVGHLFQPTRTLNDFLREHGVEMTELEDDDTLHMDIEFSKDEVGKALSSAKSDSAPGPSGQTIALYKYIFLEIPTIFCRAINELAFVPGLVQSPPFAWLGERRIVFIPKPGKEGNRIANLRPLSLLETLYKIKTRILNERMAGIMEKILYPDQHGFCRNRSIQTATVPILEAVHDAEKSGRPLQLLSVDLKSAFDTISPQVIYEVMRQEKFPPIFVDALQRLTASGTARIHVNDMVGPKKEVVCGNGQGNPPSAATFNIGSDPLLRATNAISEDYRYTFRNGSKMPTTGFADDHLHALNARNARQIANILDVYNKYREVSGLTVSIAKTSILCINTDPELMQEITRMTGIQAVDGFRYLGVQIRASYKESRNASYEAVHEGITAKCNKLYASKIDLFHRRQIIKTVVIPSYNHIFMSFGPCEEACEKIDREIIKLLWNRKVGGECKRGRRIVAKHRIDASYEMGGLKMDFTTEIANGLILNGMQRIRQQGREGIDNSFICKLMRELLRDANVLNLEELFKIGGPRIWTKVGNKIADSSPFFSHMCKAMAKMLELNETSNEGWTTASIAGHTKAGDIFRISAADGVVLDHFGLTHVGRLFGRDDMTGLTRTELDAEYPIEMIDRYAGLVTKCKNLRRRLQGMRMPGNVVMGSFCHITQGIKFSGLFRKMNRDNRDAALPGPPSYFTRRRDGIPVPPLDQFMRGYRNLFKMDIPSKTLENSYLLMNRQVWTNEKSSLSRIGGGPEGGHPEDACKLCGTKENTMHLMFECGRYSEPLWKALGDIIKEAVARESNGGENISNRMHAFLVLYNITSSIPEKYRKYIMILIQEIKRNIVLRRFKRETTDTGTTSFGRTRLYAHIAIVNDKIRSLRKYQGKRNNFFDTINEIIKEWI
jgi:hypothetical protein